MLGQRLFVVLLFVLVMVISAGCGSASKNKSSEETVSDNPVTLKVFQISAALTDAEFERFFVQPVSKKYPNITLQLIRNGEGSTLPDLVAAGTPPDIIYNAHNGLQAVIDLDLHYDLNDLIEKNKFDLAKFEPASIAGIKKFAQNDELLALPFSMNSSALFYNKDLFDKFGISYPVDHMTWQEVIELGKTMVRTEDGIQYKAIFPSALFQVVQPLSPVFTDPETDVPLLDSDEWRKAATLYKEIYSIIGNEDAAITDFFVERNLAMYTGVANFTIGEVQKAMDQGSPYNWDLVSYPNFPETKGKSMELASQIVMITSTSQHKDQAFRVLSVVTDKESQLNMSRAGRFSILADQEIKGQFGSDIPALEGKNIQAFFLNTPTVPSYGRYDAQIRGIINSETPKLIDGSQDVNTFLRNLNELAQSVITADKAAKGEK